MARQNKHGKDLVLYILMALENQLLNALASEYKEDIIEQINEELEEVQEALNYVRTKYK